MTEAIQQYRDFMKANFGIFDRVTTDQSAGKPMPPLQKPPGPGEELIDLPKPDASILLKTDFHRCLQDRRSRREFSRDPLSLEELSYLLWATQGVVRVVADGSVALRPVPSGGGRHPFETYLLINRVTGLDAGICRYLPLSHQLVRLTRQADLPYKATRATGGQTFVGESAVVFVWSCVPYRGEWRYHIAAHKTMLLDAGHLCQNLYLACESLGTGTCAVAAYDQQAMDRLIGLDGQEEFVVYLAPVGSTVSAAG